MNTLIAFLNANQVALIAAATIVMAITAVVTVLLTWGLFRENRLLRKAGTEPEVVAYLMPDPRAWGNLNFVLSNIGQGPAQNISFSIEEDEADFTTHKVKLRTKTNRAPIALLPQGQEVAYLFGFKSTLLTDPMLRPFKVEVLFEGRKGEKFQIPATMDVSQFYETVTHGSDALDQIASELRRLSDRAIK